MHSQMHLLVISVFCCCLSSLDCVKGAECPSIPRSWECCVFH